MISGPEANLKGPRGTKYYVLAILTLVYTLTFVDQNLINLLLEPIKQDLHLSDSQLGFLTGIAFALFYATAGLPFARWSDRADRSLITSVAIALWGTTVMLCLLVNNYVQLVLARIAAAFGESGGMPPTYSLAGDYFPEPAARARALAIYNLATPLAALLSYVGGGWLNARYGWRMTFFIMGVPGLLLALIVRMTIKDLRHTTPGAARPPPPLAEVLRTLWQQRSTRHLSIALILLYTLGAGVSPWYAAFLIRSHSMTTAEVGVWLGLVFGVIGAAGVLLGGYVAGHWLAEDERGQMRLTALTTASLVPCFALFLLLPSTRGAIFAMVPLVIVFNFFFGPTFALMQRLVVDEMRATTVAIVMLLVNLIGMGIGPQIIGVLSDLLRPALGDNSLRYAILIESLVAFWSAFHFWRVGKTVKEDLELAARIQVKPSPRIVADLHEAEWKAITSK